MTRRLLQSAVTDCIEVANRASAGLGDILQYDAFLSYNRKDSNDAHWLAEKLEQKGLRVFLDTADLVAGRKWEPKLLATLSSVRCCIVCIGEHGFGSYQQQEIQFAIDQVNKKGSSFSIISVFLPGSDPRADLGPLGLFTWVDLTGRSEEKVKKIVAAARGRSGRDIEDEKEPEVTQNPYKGLGAFGEGDIDFFFGRAREAEELLARVRENTFVAVVGASGSGKSSLVHAELIPLLRKDPAPGGWCVVSMRPGADPYLSLAEACTRSHSTDTSHASFEHNLKDIYEAVRPSPGRPAGALSRSLGRVIEKSLPGGRGVLVIDQLEELFLLVESAQIKDSFGADIRDLLGGPRNSWRVVVTLRADQYEPVVRDAHLGPLVAASQFPLREMSDEALKAAIVEPAKAVGLVLEEGLADRILHDMADQSHAMPLLEFLLDRLWLDRDRRRDMLTHRAYEATGGVQNAIAKHADQVYAALPQADQTVARKILVSLVRPGRGTPDSKRPIPLAGLNESERRIVNYFSEARLLASGERSAEIAHEALIAAWTRLKDWLNAERADLLAKERLEEDASAWRDLEQASPERAKALLLPPGWRLSGAESLLSRHPRLVQDLPVINDFIEASRRAADEIRERQERERHVKERARRTRLRVVAAAALGFSVIAAGAAVYFNELKSKADTGWQEASDISRVIGIDVPDALSATNGVPPDAVAAVLTKAGRTVGAMINKEKAEGEEAFRQGRTVVDITLRSAAAAFTAGSDAEMNARLIEATNKLNGLCNTDRELPECKLRRAVLGSLKMQAKFWAGKHNPDADDDLINKAEIKNTGEAADLAKSLIEELKPDLEGQLELSQRIQWVATREDARLTTALMDLDRVSADQTESRKNLESAASSADACSKSASRVIQISEAAIKEKQAGAGNDKAQADPDRNTASAVLLAARCKLAYAEAISRLDASRYKDARDFINEAVKLLDTLDKSNVFVRSASIRAHLATGQLLKREGNTKAAVETISTAEKDYRRLILENGRNFQIRSFYMLLIPSLEQFLPELGEQFFTDAKEAVLGFVQERIDVLGVKPEEEAELSSRRATCRATLKSLYDKFYNSRSQKIVEIHDKFGRFISLADPDITRSDAYLIQAAQIYMRAASSYRAQGDEAKALDLYFALSDYAWSHGNPDAEGQPAEKSEISRNQILWYYRGKTVAFISKLNAKSIKDKAKAASYLERAVKLIGTKWNEDPTNHEFQQAQADILFRQAQAALSENKAGILDFYKRAAEFGSSQAALQLREWYLNGTGPAEKNERLAGQYGRKYQDKLAVEDHLEGQSLILGAQEFDVYLMPRERDQSAVDAEIARLKKYYGVTEPKPESELRLRNIMKRAIELSRNSPELTRTHIVMAKKDFETEDEEAELQGSSPADPIRHTKPLMEDRQYGHALDELDRDTTASMNAPGGSSTQDLGLLLLQYGAAAEGAARSERSDF